MPSRMFDWCKSEPMHLPQFTIDDYENVFADRHLLHGVVAKWAKAKPEAPAILSAEGDRAITWSDFDRITTVMAIELLRLGFAKGDFLVTLLPLTVDHVLLEYSCFKIGVIVAPLDLRLSPDEVMRALEILRPRGFASLGVKAPLDLRPLWSAIQSQCKWIQHYIAVGSECAIEGTQSFASIADAAGRVVTDSYSSTLARIAVTENDGALVIFTTGSTGSPKPARSHTAIGALDVFGDQQQFRAQCRIFPVLDQHPVSIAADDGEDVVQLMRHLTTHLLLVVGLRRFMV